MKVRLDDVHSPCRMCFLKGIFYDPDSICCQRCEYNIAIKLLKRVLKYNDYCTLCKNRKRLGGGYWDCAITKNDDGCCRHEEDFAIDWQAACDEYKIEYEQ